MFCVVVEFRIDPLHLDEFHQAIVANAELSVREEAGCFQFDVCRDPADASLFFLYEIYEDRSAFDAHLKTQHFLDMSALTEQWVEQKAVRSFERVHP